MKEYIDLAEAKSKAVYMHGFGRAKFVSVANLEKCKAADVVERKRGEWEAYFDGKYLMCSACEASFWDEDGNGGSDFCPNCGADMRRTTDEEI